MFLADSSFTTAPSIGLILWSVLVAALVLAGAVTIHKGRWGWFVVGVFTGGLGWIIGALQAPRPGSGLARRRARQTG